VVSKFRYRKRVLLESILEGSRNGNAFDMSKNMGFFASLLEGLRNAYSFYLVPLDS